MSQLELFGHNSEQGQAVEEILEACTQCGRSIAVMRLAQGLLTSEFRGKNGECFECRMKLTQEGK